jgi:hypothetical protein
MNPEYKFATKVWLYNGEGAWHFATLPEGYASEIRRLTAEYSRKGFGSVRVIASIGGESWKTSIFPDRKSHSYLLPIKKEIRKKLGINTNDTVQISIELADIIR